MKTLAGFKGGFVGEHRRAPTEQEVWDAAYRAGLDAPPETALTPAAWICIYNDGEVEYTPLLELAEAAPTAIPLYRAPPVEQDPNLLVNVPEVGPVTTHSAESLSPLSTWDQAVAFVNARWPAQPVAPVGALVLEGYKVTLKLWQQQYGDDYFEIRPVDGFEADLYDTVIPLYEGRHAK